MFNVLRSQGRQGIIQSKELKSSEEGQVYWIPLEELKTRELATGMKYVLQILGADQVNECYMHLESEGYVGDLY